MLDFTLLEQTSKCSKVGLVVGDELRQKTPMTLLFCVDPKANCGPENDEKKVLKDSLDLNIKIF